ncbi:CRAL/TRIO domain-containing protein [Neolentinus lepideus HHB14362 ss-1]|uniref:CRAL/TRIO domain-containing protein n=1 Tax=Neolentinus lepideus HHB14362 ss-1 TaxID=1314782 RepID=A0A165U1Q6_9AGAM|nr:CRAL/TRIO domain-containing protein [Neolentinus lepideus HHB14362 ss-1]
MAPTHTILTQPAPDTSIKPWTYTDEQYAQIEALRSYAHSLLLPEDDPYHKWEHRWLTKPDTIPRYMRAAKWKLEDGKKRIKGTLEWRREYKPDLIPPDEVRPEAETGKIVINGFDKDGRPIIHMRPDRENTQQSPRQLRHLVWCLERTKDLMPPGVESCVILIDYSRTTLRTNPSISIATKVLHILQNHYVETLGRGVVVNLPMLLNFFYKGISPFLDPVTRDKIRFNPNLLDLIPKEQLYKEFGGEFDYEFDFESYWEQICSTCKIASDGTRVEDPSPEHAPGHETPVTLVGDHDSTPLSKEAEAISSAPLAEQTAPVA